MKKTLLFLVVLTLSLFADRSAPIGWGDFQMGVVSNNRPHWDKPLREAVLNKEHNYKVDRRYLYIADTNDIKSYWGRDGGADKNWSKKSYDFVGENNATPVLDQSSIYHANDVGNAIVIYMLQKGGDSFDIISTNSKDKDWMKEYFRYIGILVDSTKNAGNKNPIYVIEPDVWTYILQKTREENQQATKWADVSNNHLDDLCHINDLGLPWLEEFDNRLGDLPGAIIKTIKYHDPKAYAGALIGFWGWRPTGATHIGYFDDSSELIADGALQAATYMDSLLSGTPYRGDFAGIEKNGTDEGYWTSIGNAYGDYLRWDDRQNADWINFAKIISTTVDLPLVGWQIALGHPNLPNTMNSYTDTFFPYFFSHVEDYVNAGFIGMLAGAANQDRGTIPVPPGFGSIYNGTFGKSSNGDGGWFFGQMETFNGSRPHLPVDSKVYHSVVAEVIPDTVVIKDGLGYPVWNSETIYGKWDSDVKNGDTITYDNSIWRLIGWENVGKEPGKEPTIWEYIGPDGEFDVIIGGTVNNDQIYFEASSQVVRYINPQGIAGYGIGKMYVNDVEVDPTHKIDINTIDKDYTIRVKFIKGGITVATKSIKHTSTPKVMVSNNEIRIPQKGTVAIYSLQGRQLLKANVLAGKSLSYKQLTKGLYVARISGDGWSKQVKINRQ